MFYGWRVVGGSFVSQAFVIGIFTFSVSLLTQPVQETFGVRVEEVMYSLTLGTFLGLFAMPLAGTLIDRVSLRKVMIVGVLLFAAGLALIANTQTMTQYILAFGFTMAIAHSFAGALICSTVVSRWFTVNRGKALGISAIGTSAGGALIPALVAFWLPEYGWRGTLLNLSLLLVFGVLPVVLLTIRSWPVDVGRSAEPSPATSGTMADIGKLLSLGQILRKPDFWWLGLSLGLLFGAYTAMLSNLTPYATQLGYDELQASRLIMVVAIGGMLGKLLFGMAADRFKLKVSLWVAQLFVLMSFILLASDLPYALMLTSGLLLGLASGGMMPVWGALMANLFGLASYGRAMGLIGPLVTLCVLPAFPLAGRLYDLSGDFKLTLFVFSGVVVAAGVLLIPLHVNRPGKPASTDA